MLSSLFLIGHTLSVEPQPLVLIPCVDGLFGCFIVNDFANLLTQHFKRNLIYMESECVWY